MRLSLAGTRVKMVHSGFGANKKQADVHAESWNRVLGWLAGAVR
jgi:hypothetical protein